MFRMLFRQAQCAGRRVLSTSSRQAGLRSIFPGGPKNPETFNLGNMMKSYGMPSGAQHTKGPLAQHPLTLFMYCLGGMSLCVWIGPGFFPPQNMINRNWCYSQTPFLYFLGIIAAIVIAPIVNT